MTATSFLRRICQITPIDADDIDILRSLPWTTVKVKRHREIYKTGERPGSAYAIESGWAARCGFRSDGSRRITSLMVPGDFCGLPAFTREPFDDALIALVDCEIVRIQTDALAVALKASPAIARAFWMSKLIDEAVLRMWLLNSKDALQSLAHLLCELHARTSPIGEVKTGSLIVPMTQDEIGDVLGITSVHANRMLKQLREEGLIEKTQSGVRIPSVETLREFCAFSPQYLHLAE